MRAYNLNKDTILPTSHIKYENNIENTMLLDSRVKYENDYLVFSSLSPLGENDTPSQSPSDPIRRARNKEGFLFIKIIALCNFYFIFSHFMI